jgi:hypothetical protein
VRSLQRQAHLWPGSWGADEEMDDKGVGAAESGPAVELLASQPKAMKFRLMPAAHLFVLLFLLLPFLAEARYGQTDPIATAVNRLSPGSFSRDVRDRRLLGINCGMWKPWTTDTEKSCATGSRQPLLQHY